MVMKRYVGSNTAALMKADFLTRGKDILTSYSMVKVVDGVTVVIKKIGEVKTLIAVESIFDFQFIPVANRIPVTATVQAGDITRDYRLGLSKEEPTTAGDRLPASENALVEYAMLPDAAATTFRHGTQTAGSATWFGDTDNVISWNGIGAMDGCGNDFRTFLEVPLTGRYYTTPGYEPVYYPAGENHKSPEDGAHLAGDNPYTHVAATMESQRKRTDPECLYRNGVYVKRVPWPVLAACEVPSPTYATSGKTLLRVLCARWFDETEKYTSVLGNPDFFFEAHSLTGFYLYDEDSTEPSGWKLTIIEIPPLDAHPTYPTTSFIAQAPHFCPDGSVAVGILETGFGGTPPIEQHYHESKLVNQTQAWVFKIDVAAGTCALTEPAGTYRTEKDSDVDADLLNSTYTRTQILAVAPENASSIITCKRIEAVALVKSRKDSETTYPAFVPGDYSTAVFRNGSRDAVRAEMQSVFSRMTGEALAGARGIWGMGHTSVSFVIWQDNYPALDSVYPQNPYLGGVGYMSLGVGFFTDTGEIWTSFSDPWWGVGNNIEVYYPATSYSRSQTNTTTTSHKLLIGPHEVAESKIDTVRTAGYRIGFHGDGYAFTGMLWTSGWGASAEVYLYRSFGPVLETDSSTTTGALQGLRLAAADPRKSAGIVRNLTTGALTFKGVASPSGGF